MWPFSDGKLKAQVQSLTDELNGLRADLDAAKQANKRLEAQLQTRTEDLEKARESLSTVETKLGKQNKAERRAEVSRDKLKALEKDVADLKKALNESERLRAVAERVSVPEKAAAPEPAPKADIDVDSAMAKLDLREKQLAEREEKLRRGRQRDADDRVEALKAQVAELRDQNKALKDHVVQAEKNAREIEAKAKRDLASADRAVSELKENLKKERNAYRILQLQYEAQIDRQKGVEQLIEETQKKRAEAEAVLAQKAMESREAEAAEPTEAPVEAETAAPEEEIAFARKLPDAPPLLEPIAKAENAEAPKETVTAEATSENADAERAPHNEEA